MSAGSSSESPELDWDGLVKLKREISSELKKLTEDINNIDRKESQTIAHEIREQRNLLDQITEQLREIRALVDGKNAELLALSGKMSQSKNFLSVMEERLPSEKEDDLNSQVKSLQSVIDQEQFKSQHEKDTILSAIKEASMKVEAIKAIKLVREQLSGLQHESASVNAQLIELNEKNATLKTKIVSTHARLDGLYDTKRSLLAEREREVSAYDVKLREFESVNAKLDAMSAMRKKQRQEYGNSYPSDALFKVKENARKKLESGSKLTFEELKLLYSDKD